MAPLDRCPNKHPSVSQSFLDPAPYEAYEALLLGLVVTLGCGVADCDLVPLWEGDNTPLGADLDCAIRDVPSSGWQICNSSASHSSTLGFGVHSAFFLSTIGAFGSGGT